MRAESETRTNRKLLKTVRIVLAHMNLIDGKGKVDSERAVEMTRKLLDVLAETNRALACKVNLKLVTGDQSSESLLEVNRVLEKILGLGVAGVLRRKLVMVIRKTGDMMNMWSGEEIFKLLLPDAPMIKSLGRKAIGKKLKKENIEIKKRKRYSKYWRQS